MTSTPLNNDNGNGKITLAVINHKLDRLFDDLRDFKAELRRIDGCTDDLEVDHARLKTKMENLEGRVSSWSALNSIGVVVAGILAAIGLGKP
jgi:hypothetical protein